MAIRMTTPASAVEAFLKKSFDIIKNEIFMAFAKLGEESVRKVRDRTADESWIDHTANLRSSIGYSIYDYGVKQIESAFDVVKSGKLGSDEGKKMVAELAREYANVFALVVVAAMNYADKVEAIESKDVLESTRIWAQNEVNARLERAKEVALKKINALTL
jgi:polyhydroxyalkanoate synthesis regulator phasin